MVRYINRKNKDLNLLTNTDMTDSDNFTKTISLISLVSFLIGLVVFAYGYSIVSNQLGTDSKKTFTVSRSLGYGSKPGVIFFTSLAFIYLFYLIYSRGPKKFLTIRIGVLFISYSLVISLLWLTPWYNEDLHYALAGIIFSFIFIYIILTYYLMYKKYGVNKHLFLFLIILNFIATICLTIFSIQHGNSDTFSDLFASFELVFAFLFGLSIVILGFY